AGGLTCNGPLTRNVADAALLLGYAGRPDPRDGMATLADGEDYPLLPNALKQMRVSASATLGYAPLVDPEVAAAFQRAVKVIEGWGESVGAEDPASGDRFPTYPPLLPSVYKYSLRNTAPEKKDRLSPPIQEVMFETPAVTLVEYMQAIEQCQAL